MNVIGGERPRPSVLVVGFRVTGRSVATYLHGLGESIIVVEDDPTDERRRDAAALGAEFVGRPDEDELRRVVQACRLVVPSPGIPVGHPVHRLAAEAGIPVHSELELGWERLAGRPAGAAPLLVAVTGTNGKTTVSTLVAAMLVASGLVAVAAGNIGLPFIDATALDCDVLVAEVSSFQLQFTEAFRPAVSCWLNLAEDHLDWHPTMAHYAAAKARIWAAQRDGDVAVVNADDAAVVAVADDPIHGIGPGVRPVTFSVRGPADFHLESGGAGRAALVGPKGRRLLAVDELPRSLPLDVANALAALATALAAGATLEGCRAALRQFRGLPHRVELIAERDGVRWYDDSKSTTPASVLAAVSGFQSVVLIAGGRNKGLHLGVLAHAVPPVRAVVAIGDAAKEVEAAFLGRVPVTRAGDMAAAVSAAASVAAPGDVVLLSPGCASFDWYHSYAERGEEFTSLVTALLGPPPVEDMTHEGEHDVKDITCDITGARRLAEIDRLQANGTGGRRLADCDVVLTALMTVLCLIGLVMVLSASSVQSLRDYGSPWYYFERQALWLALGGAAFFVTVKVDYHRWRRLGAVGLFGSLALLVVVLMPHFGVNGGGSARWIGVGSWRVQPSELAKLALVIFAADVLDRRSDHIRDWRYSMVPVLLAFLATAALVMLQPDMGTTMILASITLTALYVAGSPLRPLLTMVGAGLGAAFVAAKAAPYRWARLTSFLHPFADASNAGYQSAQSMVALGSGRLFGLGLGATRAATGYLPNQYTDFIYAIIGEETGLLGSLLVVGLFVALAVVGIRVACRARDRFGSILAAGITAWLVGQAVINMGAVVGLLPVTGVPLPFVSYGGSSLIIAMGALGMCCNVAKQGLRPSASGAGPVRDPGRGRRLAAGGDVIPLATVAAAATGLSRRPASRAGSGRSGPRPQAN